MGGHVLGRDVIGRDVMGRRRHRKCQVRVVTGEVGSCQWAVVRGELSWHEILWGQDVMGDVVGQDVTGTDVMARYPGVSCDMS